MNALTVIYSRLPPSKIGTDSRLGFGLRLGRNADAQFLLEFGPQTNTKQLTNNVMNKKRRTVNSKKYSSDRGWRSFFNKTVYKNKKKSQKKFARAAEIQTMAPTPNSFTESTTEVQQTTVILKSFSAAAATVSDFTTEPPLTKDMSEKTTAETSSVTVVIPNQLYSSKYTESNTFDTDIIVEKYNTREPMFSADVVRLINSLMNILPVA